jgi:hypothetical protein
MGRIRCDADRILPVSAGGTRINNSAKVDGFAAAGGTGVIWTRDDKVNPELVAFLERRLLRWNACRGMTTYAWDYRVSTRE